jgi:uncharacterized protein (TIGR02453 family)
LRSGFPGFSEQGLRFLRTLTRNNNRDWFQPRKPVFEENLKAPMCRLVEALNAGMRSFAPDYCNDPARAIYRFYRDTRFSNNKAPYKDHIAAIFPRRGMPRHDAAAFYFEVSHRAVGIGGGVYAPPPEVLLAIRSHVAENHAEFRRMTAAAAVRRSLGEMQGEQLSRVPKGFSIGHPAADLVRFKQFLWWVELPVEVATTPALYSEILRRFRAMAPLVEFLNAPLARPRVRKIEPRDLFV